ncbi:hypothetical protein ACEWY4_020541 [Coilia grayii]|uniref:HAT C-terminal dimerisation domain-containing protein n=1 Tax=Coilia grayii TaxID=363190 RepID=A0ABD1JG20_9TELE
MLPNLHEKIRGELKESIQNTTAVCLTTDCWTSRTTTSYMSVTCQYIEDFTLRSSLLDCFILTERHTAEQLAFKLNQVAQEWKIKDKVVACVTDNATNIKKAVGDILKWNHVSCFAHSLNLVVRHALDDAPSIQTIIKKLKAMAEYIRRSTVATEKLRQMQQSMGQPQLRPKMDVVTRWNSTFYMQQRILEIKEPLVSTSALLNPQEPTLSHAEWEALEEACAVLAPFEEVTKEMSSESFVTGSKAILISRGLQRFVVKKQRTPPQKPSCDVNALASQINNRFGNLEKVSVLADATFLDPRFKRHGFVTEIYANQTMSRVESATMRAGTQPSSPAVSEESEEAAAASPQSETVPEFWADFEERVTNLRPDVQSPQAVALLEVKGYLSEQLIPCIADPLQWWKARAQVYKNLCTVMKTRLCIVATSVPSERIFYKTGQFVSNRRSHRTTDKVCQLAFLNANLKGVLPRETV